MKSVVITGATGLIGRALIEKCIEENTQVLAICRKGSAGIEYLPKSNFVKVIEFNLDEYNDINLDESYDVFYHFAWLGTNKEERNNAYAQNINVEYTLNAVDLAARLGCHTFIGAGSQAEYGRFEGKLNSKTPTNPEIAYGIAKLSAGLLSRIRCNELGINHIWTRILSVYGPYDDMNTMIMSTISSLKEGKKAHFTKGEQIWDYLFSEDAAQMFYLLGKSNLSNKIYCIGSGEERMLRDYINDIQSVVGITEGVAIGSIPYTENQVMHLCADITELEMDIGFIPKTDFKTGIIKTLDYLK